LNLKNAKFEPEKCQACSVILRDGQKASLRLMGINNHFIRLTALSTTMA